MKVTKYPQSCLRLEKAGRALMIDIGSFATAKFGIADFGPFESLLVTHQHADHIDSDFVSKLENIEIYGNSDVVTKFPELQIQQIEGGTEFVTAGFKVKPIDIPHCLMVDGSAGPPNTGFIIDGIFFHPGDGTEPQNFTVSSAAVPIAGPTISTKDALDFIASVGAKKVIPIHYDNPTFPSDPVELKKLVRGGVEVQILRVGESTEL